MVVVVVIFQVFGEVVDPLSEEGNLHLGRASVTFVGGELLDDTLLCLFVHNFLLV